MEPTISVGALILTKDEPIDTIEVKDIVSFYSKEAYMKGRIITHRVVASEISATGQIMLTTRGDANSSTDIHRVDEDNLIGKVIWISGEENIFAKIMNFLSGGAGFFTCIALPAIIISVIIFKRGIAVIMTDIKRLNEETEFEDNGEEKGEKADSEPTHTGTGAELSAEEYEELCKRIRAALSEELKAGNDREQSDKE
jgi:signal peptidase I